MKIQLKRSNVLDGGAAKEPTSAQMEFGELAVNYNETDPSIFMKDAGGNIVRIAGNDAVGNDPGDIEGYPDIGDGGGATLDDRYLKLAAGAGAQVVQSTEPTEFKSAVKVGGIAFPSDKAPYEVESRGILYNSSKKALLSTNKPNADGENVTVFESRIDGTQYNGDGTRSPLNIVRGTSYKAASPMGNVAGEYGSYDSYVGFHATNAGTRNSDAIWTGAADSYGVLSSVETRSEGTGNTFNFYSEGTAPNYFRGNVFVNTSEGYVSSNPGFRVRSSSTNLDDSGLEVLSYSSNTNNTRNALLFTKRDADGVEPTSVAGRLVINGGVGAASSITLISGDGNQPFIVTSSDYRTTSLSSFASQASTVVKQLNPGSNGFIAHEVAEVIPSAVLGTKDATEAIGTLVDYDGTVLETAVVEPEAEELTYTEEVETDGVSTATVRTRTWSLTGTRPIYQGVDQTKLIPLLTKALQETLDKIDTLETRLETLENA